MYKRPLAIETFIGHFSFCDEIADDFGTLETKNGGMAYGNLYVMRSDLHNKYEFEGYKKYILDLK